MVTLCKSTQRFGSVLTASGDKFRLAVDVNSFAIDPLTGRNFEDTVAILESIEWLSDEDRHKITEGRRHRLTCVRPSAGAGRDGTMRACSGIVFPG